LIYIWFMLNLYTDALSHLIHAICLLISVYLDPYQILSKVKTTVTFVQCMNHILHYTSHIDLYPNVLLSYLFGWVSIHAIHNPWSWVSWSWLSMKLSSQESSTFFIYLFISFWDLINSIYRERGTHPILHPILSWFFFIIGVRELRNRVIRVQSLPPT
jgi:hypothetical protein